MILLPELILLNKIYLFKKYNNDISLSYAYAVVPTNEIGISAYTVWTV